MRPFGLSNKIFIEHLFALTCLPNLICPASNVNRALDNPVVPSNGEKHYDGEVREMLPHVLARLHTGLAVRFPVLDDCFGVEGGSRQPVPAAAPAVVLVVTEEEAYSEREVERDGAVLGGHHVEAHGAAPGLGPVDFDIVITVELCDALDKLRDFELADDSLDAEHRGDQHYGGE